jgi:hypothetical protein
VEFDLRRVLEHLGFGSSAANTPLPPWGHWKFKSERADHCLRAFLKAPMRKPETLEDWLLNFAGEVVRGQVKDIHALQDYPMHILFCAVVAASESEYEYNHFRSHSYFSGANRAYIDEQRSGLLALAARLPTKGQKNVARRQELTASIAKWRSMTDLKENLRNGFQNRHGRNPDSAEAVRELLNWLSWQPAEPDLWHALVRNNDPDGFGDVYLWIVSQNNCDAATAAAIFQLLNPADLLRESVHAKRGLAIGDGIEVAKTIVRRWREHSFPTSRFSFDETYYFESSLAAFRADEGLVSQNMGALPFSPPSDLFDFQVGAEPNTKWFYSSHGSLADLIAYEEKKLSALP